MYSSICSVSLFDQQYLCLFGKPQHFGQVVFLLNLVCSCVWSDILVDIHNANGPAGFKMHRLDHQNNITERLENGNIYMQKISEWAWSLLSSTREALFHL